MLPATVTGSWPRPRWFDTSMWGRPLDTCMLDVRFREKFQDALAVVIADEERAGLDILTHGDFHCDEDFAGRSWHHYPLQRWTGFEGDYLQSEETRSPWLRYPPGTLLNEIYTAWRWPRVVDKIEHRPLDYPKIWRIAQGKAAKPVRFGTCCSQVMALFLDIVRGYSDDEQRALIWDMASAMNAELRDLAAAGCNVIQVEEPAIHAVASFHPENTELIDFLVDAFNHEVAGLDDVEVWVHTCWGNPNMQRAVASPSYANSVEIYVERVNADVWTIELADSDLSALQLFAPYRGRLRKKVAIGVVSHRSLQVEPPEEVARIVRQALRFIDAEQLVLSSDCGFGRQGCNRLIAYYKAAAIAQGANIVRKELGGETREVRAADPALQVDVLGRDAVEAAR